MNTAFPFPSWLSSPAWGRNRYRGWRRGLAYDWCDEIIRNNPTGDFMPIMESNPQGQYIANNPDESEENF